MRPSWLVALLLIAAPASAQIMVPTTDPFAGHDEADQVRPKTSYPLGRSDMVARGMALSLRIARAQRDLCAEMGCLVIVNESRAYQVTGFFVQTKKPDGTPEWSSNQFGRPLYARSATWRYKTGGADACDLAVRFVFRHPKTRDTVTYDARANLCAAPHNDSVIRIRAVVPEVEVGS